jgi:hypothetical protein
MSSLLEYTIEKIKGGVRIKHYGKIVHTAKDSVEAQKWIERLPHGAIGRNVRESEEGKYGDVEYADTKNKKYPVDTEKHIRAAWDYIHVGKNAANETDVDGIKKNIIKAWKEKIDKSGPPEASNEGNKMSENFIDATLKQDYLGAEAAFKEMMASNVAQYLEQRKQELASEMSR